MITQVFRSSSALKSVGKVKVFLKVNSLTTEQGTHPLKAKNMMIQQNLQYTDIPTQTEASHKTLHCVFIGKFVVYF